MKVVFPTAPGSECNSQNLLWHERRHQAAHGIPSRDTLLQLLAFGISRGNWANGQSLKIAKPVG
jgi:hypothetical protein